MSEKRKLEPDDPLQSERFIQTAMEVSESAESERQAQAAFTQALKVLAEARASKPPKGLD